MYTTAEKQLIIDGFIDKYSDRPQELHDKASNLEKGIYHLGLAIDAFNQLESGTDTSDLQGNYAMVRSGKQRPCAIGK